MVQFPKLTAMSGMLQQAKQVQEKIEELQTELAALRIEGRAGGGLVSATVNGQSYAGTRSMTKNQRFSMLADVCAMFDANAALSSRTTPVFPGPNSNGYR